jgi:hypothetical protein
MTGGLLQLVAIGVDSIFLTSNPSITLFKCVYRRYSNFSLTQRTKQILNITNFGEKGEYTLQKEGDLIHKVWLKIDISNFFLKYPDPTYENINNILNSYGLNININYDPDLNHYVNNIIPQILSELHTFVNKFNEFNDHIYYMFNFIQNFDINSLSLDIFYDENALIGNININKYTSINKLLSDIYHNFNDYTQKDTLSINDIFFLILRSYVSDINKNNDIKIYKYSEIIDLFSNQIINNLTYTIGGFDTYNNTNTTINYKDSAFYDSFKLIYIILSSLDNILISKYIGYTFIEYFASQIQKYNINNYNNLENYITLTKFLNNINNTPMGLLGAKSNLITTDKPFTTEYKNMLSNTMIYNSFYNIDIIYNKILINLLQNNTHNNNQNKYHIAYYKTFTNNVSDSTIFTTTLGTNLYGLNDNLLSIFNKYNNPNNIYQIYFANEIINNIINKNNLIKLQYNHDTYVGYFEDVNIWNKINLGSTNTQTILSNLALDSNNNIINTSFTYNNNTYTVNQSTTNIYNTYIDNSTINPLIPNTLLNPLILNNLYLLNYIPLNTIRDIATEIYNEFVGDNTITNLDISQFDYRDFDEYTTKNPKITYQNSESNIHSNQTLKMNLYQQFIFNILLQTNNTNNTNKFKLFNQDFLTNFVTNYANSSRSIITGILQPENLFTFSYNNQKIKLPPIVAIIESYRYDIMQKFTTNSNFNYIYTKLDGILNRYNVFKNIDNLNNSDYSYNSYALNGYSFANIETNTQQQLKTTNYVHAASSIWSHINQIKIRQYNSLFNNMLISLDYYSNNLGSNFVSTYNNIKTGLIQNNYNFIDGTDISNLKQRYSYDICGNTIYFYDNNSNSTYPIDTTGFDYYSFGDDLNLNNIIQPSSSSPSITQNLLNITNTYDLSSLKYNLNNISYPHITPIDLQYIYTKLKFGFNIINNTINYKQLNNPYQSNLTNILNINIPFDTNLKLTDLINLIKNKLTNNLTNNLSLPEQNILNNITFDNTKYPIFGDVFNKLYDVINKYASPTNPSQTNPFDKTLMPNSYFNYNFLIPKYNNLISQYIIPTYIKTYISNLLLDIDTNQYIINLYNNYSNLSDIINYLINIIIKHSEYKFIYDNINFDLQKIIINIFNNLIQQKYKYLNLILNLSIITNPLKNIDIDTPSIDYNSDIPYLNYLYMHPELFSDQTDIIYNNSKLDILLRNIISQNPVSYCWVPELGYRILEDLTFNLDQLLIDEYDSNLLSLIKKIHIPYDQYVGLDKLIGNTPELTTYNQYNKGNVNLYIPLNFYFCKESTLSMPMINLLYTKGIIKFKIRNLNELLIYDKNAIFIKLPKIKCNMLVQYIYLEDDERKKVASSKMEFLIEKYKFANSYSYNYKNIIEQNILRTKLRVADPTKYILWRLRVKYNDINENNYKWNINGYYDSTGKPIPTTDMIKIYFNGLIREQYKPALFDTIGPYARCIGDINEGEYIYSFALYPLMYQPSGSANLSQIDDVIIEHQLTDNFIKLMKENMLNVEMEFWAFGYNVMRMISGLAAPIFYY